jgi:type IV pilus assembly protein PilV
MSRRRPKSFQAGFSLIEILVAVLIVSVGILGVAGLQLLSLQNNTSAMFRTQAFQAAYDIIDRARANPGEDYSIAMADDPPTAQDCTASDCSRSQMRDYDQATWLAELAATLPSGDGEVDVSGGTTTVTVRWQDDRDPAAAPLDVSVETSM